MFMTMTMTSSKMTMTSLMTGAVFLTQAGIWLLACVGFLFIFWTQRGHGHVEFTELMEDTAEAGDTASSDSPGTNTQTAALTVPRHPRKMSRKVSHANIVFS